METLLLWGPCGCFHRSQKSSICI
ncbi:hypothetical protein MTR67_007276 [Solanum verrucosum]|uniref:Uncharacterized protein n=1 Tax=Solanum verrucosum TaxID=315347 RepID=A0AAF0PZN1_SOLVR|nr:hypothetical protein MTR67_007276 [Solanum verrucosum]